MKSILFSRFACGGLVGILLIIISALPTAATPPPGWLSRVFVLTIR